MHSCQISKCICLKWTSSVSRQPCFLPFLFYLTLSLSLPGPLASSMGPPHPWIHIPTDISGCGKPKLIAKKHGWVHPICQKMFSIWEIYLLHPNFNMYCTLLCLSSRFWILTIWHSVLRKILSWLLNKFMPTLLLTNVSWDAFHKLSQIFILEIVNLLKECLVISDGAKSLLKVSLQKKGGWNTKYLPSKLLPCSSKNIQKMHFL